MRNAKESKIKRVEDKIVLRSMVVSHKQTIIFCKGENKVLQREEKKMN